MVDVHRCGHVGCRPSETGPAAKGNPQLPFRVLPPPNAFLLQMHRRSGLPVLLFLSGQYPESGAGKVPTLKKHSSHTTIVTSEAQSSRGNPSLNTLAEKSWPRLLPGDLLTNLGMVHAQRADSWMVNFGQDIASYRSGNLYHCPFGDGKYRTPYLFLRHLMDGYSASRLLKTYDAHNQLALICRPKT